MQKENLNKASAVPSGPLVGAIDEGTSSARFILFRAGTAEIVAQHQQELDLIYPQEGWVEQDPMEILNVVQICIKRTVEKLLEMGGKLSDIVAIGVANQRESTIVWDKETGKPLHNCVVWLDMRTTSTVDVLLETIPNKSKNREYLKPLCGYSLSPYTSALKLKWMFDNVPAVKKAMLDGRCKFGTVDTWLLWNLTGGKNGGVHVTDVTNASRTSLMNIETLKWDPMLINFFGVPTSILPSIKSSSEIYGEIADGPLKGTVLSGCLGDQQAALVGQQCLESGQAKSTYGTGCFLLYNTGTKRVDSAHGLVSTIAYKLGPDEPAYYALEGCVIIAGVALSWLKDNLEILPDVSLAQRMAEEALSKEEGEVYFVPAFSGLYAPYWQEDARGVICGITEDTDSRHIVKATLEAVCFQVRDVLEAMNKDYGLSLTQLNVDGGMTANELLVQMQADLLGLTINRPAMVESTALGAAMVAGAAVGCWDIRRAKVEIESQVYCPKCSKDERDKKYSKWKTAIERATGWDV